jgi:FSR family fosmidomycin resistance protein-like MFS transporter
VVETTGEVRPAGDVKVHDARVIGLVSTAHFVSHVYMLLLPPLFVLIRGEYGVSYSRLGLALAAFNIVSALMQTPAGFVVDRFGARAMLIAGLTLGAAAVGLAGILLSFWALVAMFALAGLANTVFHPANYSILSQACSPGRIGQAFSIHTFSGLLGSATAPAAMLLLGSQLGWRGALVAISALGFAVALVLLLDRDGIPVRQPARKPAARADAAVGWTLLLSRPILGNLFFFVLLALSGGGISNFSVVAFGALYGTKMATANLALSAFLFMGALGVLVGGFIADRTVHHYRVAALGFAGSGAVVLTVGNIDVGGLLLIVLMSAGGLLNGIIMPSRDMMVRAVTPPGSFGKVFGFVSTGFNIGGIISPLIYGWLMDQGHPRAIFLMVAASIALSLVTVVGKASRGAQPRSAQPRPA